MRNGQDVPAAERAAFGMEWLISNGAGGSASGTASARAARRTHALLTARGEHGRLTTLLLGFEERLIDSSGSWDVPSAPAGSSNTKSGARAAIESFRAAPEPTWRLRAGDTLFERRVQMVAGHQAVIVQWTHLAGPEARLTLGPCVVCRAPEQLDAPRAEATRATQGVPGRVRIENAAGEPSLTLWHNGAFLPARVWRRDLRYAFDADASAGEDALIPGWIDGPLRAGSPLIVVASAEDDLFRRLAAEERLGTPPPRSLAECVAVIERVSREAALTRGRKAIAAADFTARQAAAAHNSPLARRREALLDAGDRWTLPLAAALDAARIARGTHLALLPSLPLDSPHAGDALRAVPALVTLRRFDEARSVLLGAIEYLDEGLAPEAFDAVDGTPRYGDPARALWLVHAADVYVRRSEDIEGLRETLYPALEGVMQFYRAGTRGVRVGDHGLLEYVSEGRTLAPADLNALWYHALVAMAQLARLLGRKENGAFYLAWARELQQRFAEHLWNDRDGVLFARLENGRPISGLEPAHVLAVSLHPVLIAPDRARRLISNLETALFTPFGLREAPGSDRAVTSWLGPWYAAYLRGHGRNPAALSRVHDWLEILEGRLRRDARPGVPSSFTALEDAVPHADGTLSTAAAGELLRAWIEDLEPSAAPERAGATAVQAL
jgi:glycogen debranching enzyme